jgi:hypothetical protein
MKKHGEIKENGKTIGEICSRCQEITYHEEEWEGTGKLQVFHLPEYYFPNPPRPPALTVNGDLVFMCSKCMLELAPQFCAANIEVVLKNI